MSPASSSRASSPRRGLGTTHAGPFITTVRARPQRRSISTRQPSKSAVRVHLDVAVRDRRTAAGSGRYFSSAWPPQAPGGAASWCGLPGGARDIRGDDVGGVPGPGCRGPRSYRIVVLGSACEAVSWTSRSGTPAAVMKACRSVWGVTVLAIPARRAVLRTIRPAGAGNRRTTRSPLVSHGRRPVTRKSPQASRPRTWPRPASPGAGTVGIHEPFPVSCHPFGPAEPTRIRRW